MPSKGQTSDMSSTANFCVVYCSEDTNSQPFGFSPLDERIGIFTVFSTRKIPFLRPKRKKKTRKLKSNGAKTRFPLWSTTWIRVCACGPPINQSSLSILNCGPHFLCITIALINGQKYGIHHKCVVLHVTLGLFLSNFQIYSEPARNFNISSIFSPLFSLPSSLFPFSLFLPTYYWFFRR